MTKYKLLQKKETEINILSIIKILIDTKNKKGSNSESNLHISIK